MATMYEANRQFLDGDDSATGSYESEPPSKKIRTSKSDIKGNSRFMTRSSGMYFYSIADNEISFDLTCLIPFFFFFPYSFQLTNWLYRWI